MTFSASKGFDPIMIFAQLRESLDYIPRHARACDPWASADPCFATAAAYVEVEVPA